MSWPTPETTKFFLLTWTLVLVAYAVLAAWAGGKESTVSVVTCEFCRDNPIAAFAVGVVAGHILWRM